MNKKIKIIDAFNQIHNGEIKEEDILTYKSQLATVMECYSIKDFLDCKIEILEDNTEEIEELDKIHTSLFNNLPEDVKINYLRGFIQEDREIINKLVKAVNKMMKEGKE